MIDRIGDLFVFFVLVFCDLESIYHQDPVIEPSKPNAFFERADFPADDYVIVLSEFVLSDSRPCEPSGDFDYRSDDSNSCWWLEALVEIQKLFSAPICWGATSALM